MSEINDSVTANESEREVAEPNPNPKHKRESDSPISVAKKPKTDDDRDPEVGFGEFGPEEDKPVVREMGFEIEADAAEDKGSRHNMEDAWVVLLDAGLNFPGKLRFLIVGLKKKSVINYHFYVCSIIRHINI